MSENELLTESFQKNFESILSEIEKGISNKTGQEFFNSLVENLAKSFGIDYSFILTCKDKQNIESIAFWELGKLANNFKTPLDGTPCETVFGKESKFYAEGVYKLFPKDTLIVALKIECYYAVPLFDFNGNSLGLLGFMNKKVIKEGQFIKSIMNIFASRTVLEFERIKFQDQINQTRYQTIVENLGEGIIIDDLNGKLLFMNSKMEEITGYSKEELIGKNAAEILLDTDESIKMYFYNERKKQKLSDRYEIKLKHKNGS
ncbi:PAS domain S-box protein, partial [bacterium]|nr:PAS domain S-box protein [bacterium]